METCHYHEFCLGRLVDIQDNNRWIKNIALSLSPNVGGSLSGVGVVLLDNEAY